MRRTQAGEGTHGSEAWRRRFAGAEARDGRHIARVDFDFEPSPVIAEVGGRRGYMSADERRRQEHRRNELQLVGKVVYFFTTEDVAESPGYVTSTMRAALRDAA